jgi:uncharacterized membrane protein
MVAVFLVCYLTIQIGIQYKVKGKSKAKEPGNISSNISDVRSLYKKRFQQTMKHDWLPFCEHVKQTAKEMAIRMIIWYVIMLIL